MGAAALAALILPLFSRWYPIESPYAPIALYAALCLVGAAVCFAFSSAIIGRTMKLIAAIERRWDAMPTQQIVLATVGLIGGLMIAALTNQLVLSAGASLFTLSVSALAGLLSVALVFGTIQVAMALSAITAVGSQIDTSTESSTP